jgi:hypothetical protein
MADLGRALNPARGGLFMADSVEKLQLIKNGQSKKTIKMPSPKIKIVYRRFASEVFYAISPQEMRFPKRGGFFDRIFYKQATPSGVLASALERNQRTQCGS